MHVLPVRTGAGNRCRTARARLHRAKGG
jgi:hypothetical protein